MVETMKYLTWCLLVSELWKSLQIAKSEEYNRRGESELRHWRLVDSIAAFLDGEDLHTTRSFGLSRHLRLTNLANGKGQSQPIDSLPWLLKYATQIIIASLSV